MNELRNAFFAMATTVIQLALEAHYATRDIENGGSELENANFELWHRVQAVRDIR